MKPVKVPEGEVYFMHGLSKTMEKRLAAAANYAFQTADSLQGLMREAGMTGYPTSVSLGYHTWMGIGSVLRALSGEEDGK
jgi:hypothetical protein